MKQVLSIGQCRPDHAAISRLLTQNFSVEITEAALAPEALTLVRERTFDLVLVNRKLDADYSEGTDIIQAMQADAALSAVPIMLITNYAEHDEAAVKMGAVSGFGKAALASPETLEKLGRFLA